MVPKQGQKCIKVTPVAPDKLAPFHLIFQYIFSL